MAPRTPFVARARTISMFSICLGSPFFAHGSSCVVAVWSFSLFCHVTRDKFIAALPGRTAKVVTTGRGPPLVYKCHSQNLGAQASERQTDQPIGVGYLCELNSDTYYVVNRFDWLLASAVATK